MVRPLPLILSLLLAVFLSPIQVAARHRPSSAPELRPNCSMVTGISGVTFTRDHGRTLAPIAAPATSLAYTYGLAALDTPDTLLAWHRETLSISTDAGCSWRAITTVSNFDLFPPSITAAAGGRAYIWSDNRLFLMRYDTRGASTLKPPADFIGLGVDPANGEHLRAGSNDGAIWESRDAGETWTRIGGVSAQSTIFYRVTFDPQNLDHIVAGTAGSGAYVSRDGGTTWQRATGMGRGLVNAFNFVISPVDPNVVWAMAIDLAESDANVPSHGRHIYRSIDGGETYVPVVDEAAGVKLVNGPVMAAHPTDPNIFYFVFGTHIFDYGTDLFRYDAASRSLTLTHNEHDDIDSIAFNPDGSVMYLGIEHGP